MTGPEPRPLLTLRIYRISGGIRVDEQPEIRITADKATDPYALRSAWPPCQCPRCRRAA